MSINKKVILKDISIEINPRKTIGIFGPSGSGKSSFIYLVTKLLKPSSGNIFLGDDNFSNIEKQILKIEDWLCISRYFTFSWNDNTNVILSENKNNKNFEEIKNNIKKSLSLAGCLELFERLEFDVGENGRRLSGGQRQRLSIARDL